jgi:hypothetical protein
MYVALVSLYDAATWALRYDLKDNNPAAYNSLDRALLRARPIVEAGTEKLSSP